MTPVSLKYADADDRAFGLCGMALALFVFESDRYLLSLDVDAEADQGLELTGDFYIPANPNLSAKGVWTGLFRQFQLTSAMMMGNLLSRALARRSVPIPRDVYRLMMAHLHDEGEEACGLTEGEVDTLCDKSYGYLQRVISYPAVSAIIRNMADDLMRRHTLDRDAIAAHLAPLDRL